jgi:hypothetical protein
MSLLIMILLVMTLLIMNLLETLNASDICNNDINFNCFYLYMTLLITADKNVYVKSHLLMLVVRCKVAIRKVFFLDIVALN